MAKQNKTVEHIVVNPGRNEKRDFIKCSVTLPPGIYKMVVAEVTQRRVNRAPAPSFSAVVRDALALFFDTPEREIPKVLTAHA
jgi:hypothetical protein